MLDVIELGLYGVTRSTGTVASSIVVLGVWVASLDHKARNNSVELRSVVEALSNERLKALDMLRSLQREKAHGYAPVGRFEDRQFVGSFRIAHGVIGYRVERPLRTGKLRVMRIAVLPFNASEGTKPALGRQFSAFASEQLRAHAEAEINTVSFLTQVEEEGGTRMAFVNIADQMLPYEQLKELFGQAEVDLVMDGMLKETESGFELTVRFSVSDSETPKMEETLTFERSEIFTSLHWLVKQLATNGEIPLPEFLAGETMEFGTKNAESFLNFLEGFDGLNYVQQANGAVSHEFSPQGAVDALLTAFESDLTFEGPYHVLIQLCRACANFRVGTFEMVDAALVKLTELAPKLFGAYFGLGEVHQSVGSFAKSAEFYEKAIQMEPNDPNLYTRLGVVQQQLNMPVNAERNFRRAFELEGDDKPSADFLAGVLSQTNREHEVPALWKGLIDANPQNAAAWAKYAMALFQSGNEKDAVAAFEAGLETAEETAIIKRYYAPYLANHQEFDRAMDFYEDCLDEAPNEIPVMIEYAQVLESAGREFEVPAVLKNVLASNPDPNIRAQTLARLIELEQPKRAESVELARSKMDQGDFEGAIRDLKPLRNWLSDYWKLWALLSSAYNKTERFEEAEDSSRRLLELFPGCEPAYGEYVASLSAQGRNEEAYQFMRYAASNNPGSLSIHVNLALAAKRNGMEEEARQLAKQIREAVGPNEELEPVLHEIER